MLLIAARVTGAAFESLAPLLRKVVSGPGRCGECDGLVTTHENVILCVTGADCGALLLADSHSGVIAACHAGWRGAVAGIVQETLATMATCGARPEHTRVFVAPCISAPSFEVGEEVAEQFPPEFVVRDPRWPRPHVDLKGFMKQKCMEKGIAEHSIEIHPGSHYLAEAWTLKDELVTRLNGTVYIQDAPTTAQKERKNRSMAASRQRPSPSEKTAYTLLVHTGLRLAILPEKRSFVTAVLRQQSAARVLCHLLRAVADLRSFRRSRTGYLRAFRVFIEMEMRRAALRQQVLLDHLRPTQAERSPLEVNLCLAGDSAPYERQQEASDDVVIVRALRTPLTKAKRGGLKDTFADDLMATVFSAALKGVPQEQVGDIVVGTVLAPGAQRANEARMASFLAGIPETVPVRTVNRQCSSGLQAVADVAAAIKAGYYDIGLAAGVETMTANPMAWEGSVNPKIEGNAKAESCLLPMGVTSENVAERYGITRKQQDTFAAQSHARAAAAQAAGKFRDEIVPVATKIVNPKTGEEQAITVTEDDGIRVETSVASLGKLKAVFKPDGSTTAGNSSQVTDGAGAVLLMTRRRAHELGLPILGVFRSFAAVGVDPAVMGIGPAVAIPEAVKRAGLNIDDIDLFELNEAFASQATYCVDKLGLDPNKVNVNGGAIALGHPLGATGARCTATLLHEMKRRGTDCRFGVVSMCIGSGMGAAAVFERGSVACDQSPIARPAPCWPIEGLSRSAVRQ
eukprot:jgi/Mesvir1/28436/Mv15859-RA.1